VKVAVLCPGPSLREAWRSKWAGQYDKVIAVNRAAIGYQCDWWVFLDAWIFCSFGLPYKPQIFTTRACASKIKRTGDNTDRFMGHDRTWVDDCRPNGPVGGNWSTYSSTTALMLAATLGAKELRLFGADMTGTREYDNYPTDKFTRDESRWKRERELFETVTGFLARSYGCNTHRMLPDNTAWVRVQMNNYGPIRRPNQHRRRFSA
jgi:hypothetical protein